MRQYNRIKARYPDKILFFRMGDFYEMFGDDAVKAAPILNITLTSRGHVNGEKIPLAGVPYHSADKYLARLLAAGEKVVIVEQTEDPKQAKGVVKREVIEILTPGTATIEGVVDETGYLYLAALYYERADKVGLSCIDLLSGKFMLDEGPRERILEKLHVLAPQEIIYPQNLEEDGLIKALDRGQAVRLTPFEPWNFDYRVATRELSEFFGVTSLDGFGVAGRKLGIISAGAIYRYLRENNRSRLDHVIRITPSPEDEHMLLDFNTIRNLELVKNLAENTERNSLYHSMNRTVTAAGARKLKNNLLHPYKTMRPILYRRQGVGELRGLRDTALALVENLKRLPDLERSAARVGMRKIAPRQVAAVKDGLILGRKALDIVAGLQSEIFTDIIKTYPDCRDIIEKISAAIVDEPPAASSKGGIIKEGFSPELDELKTSIKEAHDYIASLQNLERQRTTIPSLKVGFNKIFGYFIEVTKTHLDKVPQDYIRKQTLVNAERFITPRLKEKEELIFAAEEKIFSLEERLFNELVDWLAGRMEDILLAADLLAEVDLLAALGNLAAEKMYCCPEIDEGKQLKITGGRHPVIEDLLPPGSFIANDIDLSAEDKRIMILTGPNMSGKSTYLRQIGLLVIMAQIGSFVPAESAQLGLVDRVFTRVGAIDNLARGQSTFLVEMIETSNILHNAGENSLILLDEVGRGTSTFDGLSIAWAVVEYINEQIKARTVFATHYHELTGMASLYDRIFNCQVAVKRWENQIVFLHKIIPGGCDDSYGVEVARLAGIPRNTISRSRELLRLLESGKFSQSELARGIHKSINQRSLFDQAPSVVEEELKKVDPDQLTPLEALHILDRLKRMVHDG
jgi:DNA mismatch repair protein MutS